MAVALAAYLAREGPLPLQYVQRAVVARRHEAVAVARARRLGRASMRNVRQHLAFAFLYNALGVPIAAGALYPLTGAMLSPMIAAAAMTFSSVSVIANALRLRRAELQQRERLRLPRGPSKAWTAVPFAGRPPARTPCGSLAGQPGGLQPAGTGLAEGAPGSPTTTRQANRR